MATPTPARSDSGYATATMPMGKGQRLAEVTLKEFANGGFQVIKQYEQTSAGKRAMSSPSWLPPEKPLRADTFDALVAILRKCYGVKRGK